MVRVGFRVGVRVRGMVMVSENDSRLFPSTSVSAGVRVRV